MDDVYDEVVVSSNHAGVVEGVKVNNTETTNRTKINAPDDVLQINSLEEMSQVGLSFLPCMQIPSLDYIC